MKTVVGEIAGKLKCEKWQHIDKGWSADHKYYLRDKQDNEYLLRIADIRTLSRKKIEFNMLDQLAPLKVATPTPLEYGPSQSGEYAYLLLTWMPGKDAEQVLPNAAIEEQRHLGTQAGQILSSIHAVDIEEKELDWFERYSKKIKRVIDNYRGCEVQIPYGEKVVEFIKRNQNVLRNRSCSLQHGDFHVGNFVIDEKSNLGVIDFNRCSIGDPWEEFDRYVFTWSCSREFARAQIESYFSERIPEDFMKAIAVYAATNMLASIPWAIPFSEKDVAAMVENCNLIYAEYDEFATYLPKWYTE